MTLPSSGPISFNAINVELGQAGTTTASLGQTSYRNLAGVASGAISLSNFYGKSSVSYKGTNWLSKPANSFYRYATGNNSWPFLKGTTQSIYFAQNYGGSHVSNPSAVAYVKIDNATESILEATQLVIPAGVTAQVPKGRCRPYAVTSSQTSGYAGVFSGTGINTYYDQNGNVFVALRDNVTYNYSVYTRWDLNCNKTHEWRGTWGEYSNTAYFNYFDGFSKNTLVSSDYVYIFGDNIYKYSVSTGDYVGQINATPARTGSTQILNMQANTCTTGNTFYTYARGNAAWGNYNLYNRYSSSGSLIEQQVFTFTAPSVYPFVTGIGGICPLSNIGLILGAARIGGTTSTYNRPFKHWFNFNASSGQPSFITGGHNSTNTYINKQPYNLIACDGTYSYWLSYDSITVYKTNSSGIVQAAYNSSISFVASILKLDGTITVNSGTYNGNTSISRLIAGNVNGFPAFSLDNTYTGQYIYNILPYDVSYAASLAPASYPPTTGWGYPEVVARPPTLSSGNFTTYSVTGSDIAQLPLVNG